MQEEAKPRPPFHLDVIAPGPDKDGIILFYDPRSERLGVVVVNGGPVLPQPVKILDNDGPLQWDGEFPELEDMRGKIGMYVGGGWPPVTGDDSRSQFGSVCDRLQEMCSGISPGDSDLPCLSHIANAYCYLSAAARAKEFKESANGHVWTNFVTAHFMIVNGDAKPPFVTFTGGPWPASGFTTYEFEVAGGVRHFGTTVAVPSHPLLMCSLHDKRSNKAVNDKMWMAALVVLGMLPAVHPDQLDKLRPCMEALGRGILEFADKGKPKAFEGFMRTYGTGVTNVIVAAKLASMKVRSGDTSTADPLAALGYDGYSKNRSGETTEEKGE